VPPRPVVDAPPKPGRKVRQPVPRPALRPVRLGRSRFQDRGIRRVERRVRLGVRPRSTVAGSSIARFRAAGVGQLALGPQALEGNVRPAARLGLAVSLLAQRLVDPLDLAFGMPRLTSSL